jgi:hypothetical protein
MADPSDTGGVESDVGEMTFEERLKVVKLSLHSKLRLTAVKTSLNSKFAELIQCEAVILKTLKHSLCY